MKKRVRESSKGGKKSLISKRNLKKRNLKKMKKEEKEWGIVPYYASSPACLLHAGAVSASLSVPVAIAVVSVAVLVSCALMRSV